MEISELISGNVFAVFLSATFWLGFPAILLLLFLSALVSGSEVAFFSLGNQDYEELETEEGPVAKRLLLLKDHPKRLLATILIANNFINIAIVLVSSLLLNQLFPQEVFQSWASGLIDWFPVLENLATPEKLGRVFAFLITVLGITFLLVLFGEVAPKVYARFNALQMSRRMSGPMLFMMRLFKPVSWALIGGTSIIESRLSKRHQDNLPSREDIDEAIDLTVSHSDEESSTQDVDILKRILTFSDVTVRQIMCARVDVVAVDQSIGFQELLKVLRDSGYSRIPVFEEDFDHVKGILYVKDVLGHRHEPAEYNWQELVREEVLFVPESKKISDLLQEFQQQKTHLAVVVDEYGGSEGIVTLEDILEEVIGDIQDEFDDEEEIIYQQIDDLNFIFEGKTSLNDVCRLTKIPTNTFDDIRGESQSFAGLILEIVGKLPALDDEVAYGEYRFKILAVGARRVEEILITLPEVSEEYE
ncbi:MAG: gliding motility-associated protein GldE [Bacteroidota bacterium]